MTTNLKCKLNRSIQAQAFKKTTLLYCYISFCAFQWWFRFFMLNGFFSVVQCHWFSVETCSDVEKLDLMGVVQNAPPPQPPNPSTPGQVMTSTFPFPIHIFFIIGYNLKSLLKPHYILVWRWIKMMAVCEEYSQEEALLHKAVTMMNVIHNKCLWQNGCINANFMMPL